MERIVLQWYGPYRWIGDQTENIFYKPEGQWKGIYLWTVPMAGQYLVHYVGITAKSFQQRLRQEQRDYSNSYNRVYDSRYFSRGEKVILWAGNWTRNRSEKELKSEEFKTKYHELKPHIDQMIDQVRIFVAPMDSQRMSERIEAAVESSLHQQGGKTDTFLAEGISYRARRENEPPTKVSMKFPVPITGLGTETEIVV